MLDNNRATRKPQILCTILYGKYNAGQRYMSVALWNVCIDMQEVSIVLDFWATVYRHMIYSLVHIHVCGLMHSTTLQIYCPKLSDDEKTKKMSVQVIGVYKQYSLPSKLSGAKS